MITVSNVANASRGELLCITYELLLEAIEKAGECEDKKDRKPYIEKALEIIKMLAGTLILSMSLHMSFLIFMLRASICLGNQAGKPPRAIILTVSRPNAVFSERLQAGQQVH